jgi:RNA polymerase sigma-70 factor (ECF subfamily)
LRKRTRRSSDQPAPPEEQSEILGTAGDNCEAVWELEWKAHLLKTAIQRVKHRVKEEHFQIFDLYALREWPVNKVAKALGVSAPVVYLAKHRVGAMIKKEILAMEKGQQ